MPQGALFAPLKAILRLPRRVGHPFTQILDEPSAQPFLNESVLNNSSQSLTDGVIVSDDIVSHLGNSLYAQ